MRMGKGGKWVKTGASWRDIASPYGQPGHRPRPPAAGRAEGADRQRAARPHLREHPDRATRPVRPRPLVPARAGGRGRCRADRRAPGRRRRAVRHQSGDQHRPHRRRVRRRHPLDRRSPSTANRCCSSEGRSGLIGTPPHGLWIRDGGRLRPHRARRSPAPGRRPARRHAGRSPSPPTTSTSSSTSTSPALARARHGRLLRRQRHHHHQPSSTASSLVVERTALDAATLRWYGALPPRASEPSTTRCSAPAARSRDRAAEAAAIDALELPTHLLPTLADFDGSPRDTTVSRARRSSPC